MRIEIIDAADVNSNLVTFHISPAVVSVHPVFYYKIITVICFVFRHCGKTKSAGHRILTLILK